MKYLLKMMVVENLRVFQRIWTGAFFVLFSNRFLFHISMDAVWFGVAFLFFLGAIFGSNIFWKPNFTWILMAPVKRIHIVWANILMYGFVLIVWGIGLSALLAMFSYDWFQIGMHELKGIWIIVGALVVFVGLSLLCFPMIFYVSDPRSSSVHFSSKMSKQRRFIVVFLVVLFLMGVKYSLWRYSPLLVVIWVWCAALWISIDSTFRNLRISSQKLRRRASIAFAVLIVITIMGSVVLRFQYSHLTNVGKASILVHWGIALPQPSRDEVLQMLALDGEAVSPFLSWRPFFLKRYSDRRKIDLETEKQFDLSGAFSRQENRSQMSELFSMIDIKTIHAKDVLAIASGIKANKKSHSFSPNYNGALFDLNDLEVLLSEKQSVVAIDFVYYHPSIDSMTLILKHFMSFNDEEKMRSISVLNDLSGESFNMKGLEKQWNTWTPHFRISIEECASRFPRDLEKLSKSNWDDFRFCLNVAASKKGRVNSRRLSGLSYPLSESEKEYVLSLLKSE